ncbi:MAG: glycerophosphoryl diester phosphodiesterase [Pseudonocardiales bacterium]|jgi:glycerophosphoryl diester phosphodiesterase|nr:glycerophosphoryl diester phosphodiesterase [Pseudonocardiales bacterium]
MSLPTAWSRARRPPLPANPSPLIIAHRGASGDVAEHTLPAYLAAIDTGADGLECDVRLTRDGHLVCVHDRTVNRTSNGSGIVSELDLSGLQQLDFRSWRAEQVDSPYLAGVAPDRLRADDTKVLTLEVLLGVVADAGRPVKLLIETKHPTRYGGLVEKELVRLLRRFGSSTQTGSGDAQVTVMSFAPVALRRVRLLAPQLPLVVLLDRASPIRRDGSLPTGVDTAGPSIRLLRSDPRYVDRVHALGGRVYCWTVDEPRDVALAAGLGVDAIITNRPAAVRQQLDQLRA